MNSIWNNQIWNNNINAFCARFPGLAQMFSDIIENPKMVQKQAEDFWQLGTAKNGSPTANYILNAADGKSVIHLHSAYNPEREAAGVVGQSTVQEKSDAVFLGFGLGYHVIEWAKNKTALKIIEPDPVHFFAALMVLDWTQVFKIENLVIALGCPVESIVSLLEGSAAEKNDKKNIWSTELSNSYIFNLPAFTAHAQPYFDAVKTLIDRNITKNQINAATLKKFSKLWSRNCNKNQIWLRKEMSIETLPKNCQNFIIVAAGPTLAKLFPKIKELQKKCKIICVETSLHALLSQNITPDFIILTDPQFWAYKHIAGLHAPNSILVTEITAYPATFRFDCKKIMLCKSQTPQGQELEEKAGIKLVDLGAGGSVASAAWNLAYYLGAKNIYLAGLDLAYPGKQTHIKGSSAEQTFHTKSSRITSVEKMNTNYLFSANAATGTDYKNSPVLTDSKMKMFAWWFESRIAACPDVKTFTLSSESLKIPGIEVMTE